MTTQDNDDDDKRWSIRASLYSAVDLPRRRKIRRRKGRMPVAIIVVPLVVATILRFTRAYIISGELPSRGRIALLRKLTNDICNAHPGTLTASDLTCTHEILSAWANWDVVGSSSHAGSGRERAILQEGLLKRPNPN